MVGVLAGRLAAALELAGALLGAVALQAGAVLPLLRTAAAVLTVDGLGTLQVKCIGACEPAFSPSARGCGLHVRKLQRGLCGCWGKNGCPCKPVRALSDTWKAWNRF